MLRIALFTPVSPVRSGLAEHIEGLLPALARSLDITVVTDGRYAPSHPIFQPGAEPRIAALSYDAFRQCADGFDVLVYQLGNEASIHGYMLDALPSYPGLVFLHDLCLHHAILGHAVSRGDPETYVAEMHYNYGAEGIRLARQVLSGQGEEVLTAYPVIDRVLDDSLALIVSNRYMLDYIRTRRPELCTYLVPLQFQMVADLGPGFDGAAFRRSLGLGDVPLVATLGLYSPYNRLDVALRAFRRLLQRHPRAIYLLVGSPGVHGQLADQIAHLGLTENVRLTGWVSDEDFTRYMHIADVAVQLRYPHAGGTSYPPILLLGLGVPTIISDIEPMADIPDDAIVRIQPEAADEEEQLFAALDYVLTQPEVASGLAARGKAYVTEHRALDVIAQQFVSVIRDVAEHRQELSADMQSRRRAHIGQQSPSRGGMADLAAEALAQLGVDPCCADLLRPIAWAIHALIPCPDPAEASD
jgi:glycosyltransferase involved in cell wall biosynthesis